jgi:hypothetical protein
MTATGHALIGTVIAAKVGNPLLAVPIALGSHFLADAIPHWDTGTNREKKSKPRFVAETIADVILGFVLSWILLTWLFPSTNLLYAFIMIIVSQLPDWITAPYLFLNWDFPPFSWSYEFGKKFDIEQDLPWGMINQVVALIAVIFLGKML